MTFNIILKEFIAPVFFFLSLVMMVGTGLSLYEALIANSGYIVIAGLLFVLGWIAGRAGLRVLGMIEAAPKQLVMTGASLFYGDDSKPGQC